MEDTPRITNLGAGELTAAPAPASPVPPNMTGLHQQLQQAMAASTGSIALSEDPTLRRFTRPDIRVPIEIPPPDPDDRTEAEKADDDLEAVIPANISVRMGMDREARDFQKLIQGPLCPNDWKQFFPIAPEMSYICFFIHKCVRRKKDGSIRFDQPSVLYMHSCCDELFQLIAEPLSNALEEMGKKLVTERVEEEKNASAPTTTGDTSSELPAENGESTPTG